MKKQTEPKISDLSTFNYCKESSHKKTKIVAKPETIFFGKILGYGNSGKSPKNLLKKVIKSSK